MDSPNVHRHYRSPFWFISRGEEEAAKKTLTKLHDSSFDIEGRLAEIKTALHQQAESSKTQGGFKDCFKRDSWKRTTVCLMGFVVQNFSGIGWIIGYVSYFMQLAGISPARSFDLTVAISGIQVAGNLCSWVLVEKLGRRGTMLWGASILLCSLLVIAILAVASTSQAALNAQIALMAIWGFGMHPRSGIHFT